MPAGFVAPPRTVSDITAILDSEKPDPQKIAQRKAAADAMPAAGASRQDLARFHYDRGNARAQLGRLNELLVDANKAVEIGRGAVDLNLFGRLLQFLGLQYAAAGDPKKGLTVFQRQIKETNAPGAKGYLFGGHRQISMFLIQMGDVAQADTYLGRNTALIQEARTSGLPGWRSSYAIRGQAWESEYESHRAMIFEARGQYRDAENSYRLAERRMREAVKAIMGAPNPPPELQLWRTADMLVVGQARMKARQGRLAEAEADARRALLARLQDDGKYNPGTPRFVLSLADILVEQGRYAEAEKLARVALEINRAIGVSDDSYATVQTQSNLAGILNLQRKNSEASAIYAEIDKAISGWEPQRRQVFDLNRSRIYSLYASGQVENGLAAAQALLKREIARVGEKHFETASARGIVAVGLTKAGRPDDAAREFRQAIPLLMASARENADDDDTTIVAARSQRLQNIVEAYIGLLAQTRSQSNEVAVETFGLADSIRGRSVQQALAASSARTVAKDAALADLVRKEQDLTKQVNAQLGLLNNVLTLSSSERDENGVRAINASITKLRADRDGLRKEITKQFPAYADLIDPKAPSVDDIKATLKSDEALLSFYFGRETSFVWAVPKTGNVAFAAIPATAGDLESKIRKLREALEPQASSVSDIPAFDLKLGYEIYSLLLKPVEAGWKSAKNLVVVTNGALGLLPLSLLPTAPSEIKDDDGPAFAGYRHVPWLARSHAVTVVPSAAAFKTLRSIPPGSDKRERLIGFGDPLFSKAQAEEAALPGKEEVMQLAAVSTRGIPLKRRSSPQLEGVDNAELALLPRLPDTADELRSIALALEADPSKVLQLGAKANEQAVKNTDLSRFKIIVFATHGLVPGELNGLTQPALALSAPDVTGDAGDGLLTMEEILALRLDADWVVLSACNTGLTVSTGFDYRSVPPTGRSAAHSWRSLAASSTSLAMVAELVVSSFRSAHMPVHVMLHRLPRIIRN